MHRFIVRFGLPAALFVLLAACATYRTDYTPPPTAKGKACAKECQADQRDCIDKENLRVRDSNAQCEREANIEYTSCLKYAADRDKCSKKGCYDYAKTSFCEGQFRGCYQDCGGKVTVTKEE